MTGWRQARSNPWVATTPLWAGSFIVLLDTTIVNIARPAMVADLQASLTQAVWVSTAYLLAFAVPLLPCARLADRYGPKLVFLVGLVVFTLSSTACGLAPNAAVLVAARAVQGLGAAAMAPQGLTFTAHLFPPSTRGVAFGVSGTISGIATVIAPLLGGALVESMGWRSIFLINVPIGLAALALTAAVLPNWRPGHSGRLDPIGIALVAIGLAALVYGLQEGGRYGWGQLLGPITVPHLLVAAGALLAAFVWRQRRNPEDRLLDLRLFAHSTYSRATLTYIALGFAMSALWIPTALYLQAAMGLSPLLAGLVSAPVPAVSAIVAPLAGRLTGRTDPRRVTTAALGLLAAGVAVLALQLNQVPIRGSCFRRSPSSEPAPELSTRPSSL